MRNPLIALLLLLAIVTACSSDEDATSSTSQTTDNTETVTVDSNYTYELPVIFHVLYNNRNASNQYISAGRLSNLLTYVNQIYQGNVYGESENVGVKFVLAEKDEDGNTLETPGVEYVQYTGEYPIDVMNFMNDNTGQNVKYIWDPNSYINVMMFNFKQTSDSEITLGISHMPYTHKGTHQVEGLEAINQTRLTKNNLGFAYCSAINSLYAGPTRDVPSGYYQSDRYTNADHEPSYILSSDIVVTVAHELGHYLGLFHAFTENVNVDSEEPADSCADTDYCSDTYSYNRYRYMQYLKTVSDSAPADSFLLRMSCDGDEYYSANIMDYSMTLGYKISKEQKERIRNVLYYSPLIPGPKLSVTGTRAAESDGRLDLKIRTMK